jgi:AAA15 family ATPase/GTPase
MLNHLHIENFRLFHSLHISKLGQINLIAGKNNTGKTTLLEALSVHENPLNNTIYIPIDYEVQMRLRIELWNRIEFDEYAKKQIVDILNILSHQEIEQISMSDNAPKIKFANGIVEKLSKSGNGLNRLFILALGLVNAKSGRLLIDDFEISLHHRIQDKLWKIIFRYAKEWHIQVFATTYSEDTLQSFYYVAEKTPQYGTMANYFTLNHQKSGYIKAIDYDLEDIEISIIANLEIR